ncbi:hypothetical protein HMPREF9554_02299 [Treponema phagedenis F0421]|nr:hypothetical protein HMPREF9554_02299 [Treponema phagedenis F0421]
MYSVFFNNSNRFFYTSYKNHKKFYKKISTRRNGLVFDILVKN